MDCSPEAFGDETPKAPKGEAEDDAAPVEPNAPNGDAAPAPVVPAAALPNLNPPAVPLVLELEPPKVNPAGLACALVGASLETAPKEKPPEPPAGAPKVNPPDPIDPAAGADCLPSSPSSASAPGRGVSQATHFLSLPAFGTEHISHFQLSLSTLKSVLRLPLGSELSPSSAPPSSSYSSSESSPNTQSTYHDKKSASWIKPPVFDSFFNVDTCCSSQYVVPIDSISWGNMLAGIVKEPSTSLPN
mmetsp:Transcript_90230/g.135282  ORF Transcript_90230/g.135282 Transcript_90230/m.135282 type:complete len:245 (-) Transcript_90230:688-1422(-)